MKAKPAGEHRRFRMIQEGMDRHEMGMREAAKAIGVSYALVHRTARGRANNKRVLRFFLSLGIDPEVLDLPEVLKAELRARGAA